MAKINLNQFPYFDDYNEKDKYYQILFKPGKAVQARELTQLQSILQKQIERLGSHLFLNGSQVIPASTTGVVYSAGNGFLKLTADSATLTHTNQAIETNWIGKVIENEAGVQAKVIGYRPKDALGEIRLFVNYQRAATSGSTLVFYPEDKIKILETSPEIVAQIPTATQNGAVTLKKTGSISSITLSEGVYFFNGFFVYVEKQQIFITPPINPDDVQNQNVWDNKPTALIGLNMSQIFKTSEDDPNLRDVALGTPNYSAPGADRLYIDATLEQRLLQAGETRKDENFINLASITNGEVTYLVLTPSYGPVLDTLARRTYDESGDYTVSPFVVHMKEFLRTETNNGVHEETEFYRYTTTEAEELASRMFNLSGDNLPSGSLPYCEHPTLTNPVVYLPGTSYSETEDTSFKNLCDSYVSARIDPGKAYVKGYEIQKLGRTTVDIPKARTLSYKPNQTVFTQLGFHFLVKDVRGAPDFSTHQDLELYAYPYNKSFDSNSIVLNQKIGTAKLLRLEFYEGVVGSDNSGTYKLYLYDVKMDGGRQVENVKSIYSPSPNQNFGPFYANTVTTEKNMLGTVSRLTAAGTAGVDYTLYGSGTRWKNDSAQKLSKDDVIKVGPYIYIVAEEPATDNILKLRPNPYAIVESDGTPVSAANDPGNPQATQSSIANAWPNGSAFSYLYSLPETDANNASLVFALPDAHVAALREGGTNPDVNPPSKTTPSVNYTAPKHFSNKTPITELENTIPIDILTFDANSISSDETFAIFSNRYVVINETSRTWLRIVNGTSKPTTSNTAAISVAAKQLKIAINGPANSTYTVIAPVVTSVAKERKKVLQKGSFDAAGDYIQSFYVKNNGTPSTSSNSGGGCVVVSAAGAGEISLHMADVFRLNRVIMSLEAGEEPSGKETLDLSKEADITSDYILDNGQRDYYYGIGKITLKPTATKPTGTVRVEFDYFTHSSDGGKYFSVDSYPIRSTGERLNYSEMPLYRASDGATYRLADCIDFRRKVTDQAAEISFDNFNCSYYKYIGRNDKIILNSKNSKFELSMGVPAENPLPAKANPDGMTICELTLDPYTADSQSIILLPIDNRRYTMRDIEKLETRIKKLEYYTALTLLEVETATLNITDAAGNTRFKNGFLADNFNTYSVCDLSAMDFRAALNISEGVARPIIYKDSIGLYEAFLDSQVSEDERGRLRLKNNNYQKTGQIFTLPYKPVVSLRQGLASRVMNINPFAAPSYIGDIKLTPWSDEWRELNILPDIRNIDDAQYKATLAANGLKAPGTSIQYDEDMQTWYGPVSEGSTPKKTGRKVLKVAGHNLMEKLYPNVSKSKWPKKIKVPPPYANAGQEVPVGWEMVAANETASVTTQTAKDIQHGIATTVSDAGLGPENRSLTLAKTTSIQWMRSREVEFVGNCFRPFAQLYAFFDDINVSQYCRPAQDADWINYKIVLSVDSASNPANQYIATIDPTSPNQLLSGSNWSIRPGAEIVFNNQKFEITNVLSGTVFLIKFKQTSTNKTQPQLNFVYDAKITKFSYGDPLLSDSTGTIKGVFNIPCTDSIKFKTGDATFRLTTSSQNVKPPNPIPQNTSWGDAKYHATGWLDTEQYTVTQTRLVTASSDLTTREFDRDPITNKVLGEGPTFRYDPIAQTFLVKEDGGCYITSVDVFFYSKPEGGATSPKLPVRLQLRTVLNGMPTEQLPAGDLSTVVKPWSDIITNSVNLATAQLTVNGEVGGEKIPDPADPTKTIGYRWTKETSVKSENQETGVTNSTIVSGTPFVSTDMALDMIPTRFTFDSPIYLENGKDYALVLLSDSNEYEVWVAQTGKNDENPPRFVRNAGEPNKKIGTDTNIGTSVYTDGNFYKSHNGSGWAIDNTMTLKFALHKAEFNTNVTGEIDFYNEQVADRPLLTDGIQVFNGDHRFRIVLPNHGLSLGDKIKITNITTPIDTGTSANPKINGILRSVFSDLKVISTEVDHILVTNAANKTTEAGYVATKSGRIGGSSASISDNKRFEAVTILTSAFVPNGTSVEWKMVTTSSNGINNTSFTPSKQPYINFDINQQVEFESSMRINCAQNETQSQNIKDKKSLIVTAILRSTNKNLSPVTDESRFTAALVANRLDNPCGIPQKTTQNLNDVFDNLTVLSATDAATNKVFFSTSTGALEGTFTSGKTINGVETPSTIVTRDTSTPTSEDIRNKLKVGDFVLDASSQQMVRVAELLAADQFRTDIAFNPPLVSATICGNPQDLYIKTADLTIAEKLSQLDVGKYVVLSGASSDLNDPKITRNMSESAAVLVKAVEYTPGSTTRDPDLTTGATPIACACKITFGYQTTRPKGLEANSFTLIQKDRYIDEIAPNFGSTTSKYICKKLVVDRVSNALRISFDASRDASCEIDLYYRTEKPNSTTGISQELWIKAPYNVDINGILTEKTPTPDDSPFSYSAYESTINNLVGFTAAQVKIVLRGGNAAKPPKIKNFRMIVLDE